MAENEKAANADSYADWAERHYREEVRSFVSHLHRVADEIEREALNVRQRHVSPQVDDHLVFGDAAARGMQSFQWGIANAGYDGVIRAAIDADLALRVQEPKR